MKCFWFSFSAPPSSRCGIAPLLWALFLSVPLRSAVGNGEAVKRASETFLRWTISHVNISQMEFFILPLSPPPFLMGHDSCLVRRILLLFAAPATSFDLRTPTLLKLYLAFVGVISFMDQFIYWWWIFLSLRVYCEYSIVSQLDWNRSRFLDFSGSRRTNALQRGGCRLWINFGQPLEPSPISAKDEMSKWKQKNGKKKSFAFSKWFVSWGLSHYSLKSLRASPSDVSALVL